MNVKTGDFFKCIKNVYMDGDKRDVAYIKGHIYPSENDKCITDETDNKNHVWVVENDPEVENLLHKHFVKVKKSEVMLYCRKELNAIEKRQRMIKNLFAEM